MREREYGMPDGVALAMSSLAGWLYDDDAATSYLKYEDDFAFLRKALDEGYFERLIREVFLDSDHMAEVEIVPVDGNEDAYEEERLAAVEAAMTPEDYVRVADEEAALRRLQEEPDSPEALAVLPRLSVADIKEDSGGARVTARSKTRLFLRCATTFPRAASPTPYRHFDLDRVAFDELPYVAVLGLVLGKLGNRTPGTASELDTLVNGKLGNLTFFAEIYESETDPAALAPEVRRQLERSDRERPRAGRAAPRDHAGDRLLRHGQDQGRAAAAPHRHGAGLRGTRGMPALWRTWLRTHLPAGAVREQLGRRRVSTASSSSCWPSFDERAEEAVLARLADLAARPASPTTLSTLSFTGTDDDYERFLAAGAALGRTRPEDWGAGALSIAPDPVALDEAFIVPTDVCYAAQGFDRRAFDAGYTGAWQVAARALSYDYLWNEVRVKGGAYGAGFQTARTGNLRFYSGSATRTSTTRWPASPGLPSGWPSSTPPPRRWRAMW